MTRTQIIQSLIDKFNYKSFCEIGYQNGVNFNGIKCGDKVSVDPDKNCNATYKVTSDLFFKQNTKPYNIYFIDGLHEANQVLKDIRNALRYLSSNGAIVCHDMNPQSELTQRVPRESKVWNGDCWKAFVTIKLECPYLEAFTINTDHGCSIIRNPLGRSIPIDLEILPNLSYSLLEDQREEWLNLISVDQFKQWLNKQ